MRGFAGSIGFGLIVALMLFSPFLLIIGILFVIGLVVAGAMDLFGGRGGGRSQSPFRGYRD